MPFSVEIITSLMHWRSQDVWAELRANHMSFLADTAECGFKNGTCRVGDIEGKIGTSLDSHFGLHIAGGEIHYGHVTNFDHSLIWVDGLVSDVQDADSWVRPFLAPNGFVQAWLYDRDYGLWQNAEELSVYEAHGRNYAGLPMRSNGLPPPLEDMVIDTSGNPGRRRLREGYVEAVGAVMWIGSGLLDKLNLKADDLLSQDWLRATEESDSVVRVQVSNLPFTSAEGTQADLQMALRSLLFG